MAVHLPESSRKLITDAIDKIYERLRQQALGPYYITPAGARVNTADKALSIPGVYSSAFSAGPLKNQQPSFNNIKSITSVTDAYIVASREKFKAKTLAEVEAQLKNASAKDTYNLEQELNEALTEIFDRAHGEAKQILDTEIHKAKTIGINDSVVEFAKEQGEDDPSVYALTRMDGKVCKYCKDFYELDDGTPKVYKLSELSAGYMDKKDPEPVLPGMTHPNCILNGDARVLTKEGYKAIKRITIGDYVWTHKMRWQKVINTLNWYQTPYKKDYYTVKFSGTESNGIAVTPDHKFLTAEGFVAVKDLKGQKILKLMRKCVMCEKGKEAAYPGYFCGPKCRDSFLSKPIENAECIKPEEYYIEECQPYIMYDKSIEPTFLYDITVEKDHSFVVEGIVSSNCRCILLYMVKGFKLLPGGKLDYVSDSYDEYEHQRTLSKKEVDYKSFAEHECDHHEPFQI